MKNDRITLEEIKNNIAIKVFNKTSSSKDNLSLFVEFMVNKRQVTDDVAKNDIKKAARTKFGMPSLIKTLNEEDLREVNKLLNLGLGYFDAPQQDQVVRGMPADSEAADSIFSNESSSAPVEIHPSLYKDLVLFCDLPSRYDVMTIDQKTEVYKIYKEIFKFNLDKLSFQNYDRVKKDIGDKLFFAARYDLFRQEGLSNAMEITTKFPNRLINHMDSEEILSKDDPRSNVVKSKAKESVSNLNQQITFEDRIKYMMRDQGLASWQDDLQVKENPAKSASNTYIVSHNGKKYYAKSFDGKMSIDDKINPKEMFLYKLMEYVGFGPKSDFLIKSGSGHGGSISFRRGNFILTEDVAVNGNKFLLDTAENKEDIKKFADCNAKEFAIEISSASVLADILSIVDVFGKNFKNYGLVGNPESPNDVKLQFIDYQYEDGTDGEKNDVLFKLAERSDQRAYSPRQSLVDKHRNKAKLSPIAELALNTRSGDNGFSKDQIRSDVINRLFGMEGGAQDRQYMGLEDAINKAENDVLQKVALAKENFMPAPNDLLQEYISEIKENIRIYRDDVCADKSQDDDYGSGFNPSCS